MKIHHKHFLSRSFTIFFSTSNFNNCYCSTTEPITCLLQQCKSSNDFKSIHGFMIKINASNNAFFVNQFTSSWSRLHEIDDYILSIFDRTRNPNVFVYNSLFSGYVRWFMPVKSLQLFLIMCLVSVKPTCFTYSSLLKACTQASALVLGQWIHGKILKAGFESQIFVQTGLIDFYSNLNSMENSTKVFDEMLDRDVVAWTAMVAGHACSGDMGLARKLFNQMSEKTTVSWNTMIAGYARVGDAESAACLFNQMPNKDVVSWTSMISCYSQNGFFKEAIETFESMKAAGFSPDEITVATVISACAHLGALGIGRSIHYVSMLQGLTLDVYVGSALIDMYAKCGWIERSLVVFYKLRKKNLFCWNAIIDGLAVHGKSKEALNMFDKMQMEGIKPNGVSFVSVLRACTHARLVEDGRRIFSSMSTEYSLSPEVEHFGCIVDLLSRAGLLEEALDLIRNMPLEPNAIVWGALLAGCKLHGDVEIGSVAAQKLFELEPDNSGYQMLVLNMFAEAREWSEILKLRSLMKENGMEKANPGCSRVEVNGIVNEFAAADTSHPLHEEICRLLLELDEQLKLSGIQIPII